MDALSLRLLVVVALTSATVAGEINKEDFLKSRLKEYGLVTPISTDSGGHFLSHLLSANHKKRVKRNVPNATEPAGEKLFFNVTAFGKEFHLRLWPNSRLVAPNGMLEWHDEILVSTNGTTNETRTDRILRKELIKTNCSFIGDITDTPGGSVAINNCDGLVSFLTECTDPELPLSVYL
ncbi:A disintegrin and metalloproteinase with thrombospondin motifs 3 isoform X1 [Tachysurus ichikawai]